MSKHKKNIKKFFSSLTVLITATAFLMYMVKYGGNQALLAKNLNANTIALLFNQVPIGIIALSAISTIVFLLKILKIKIRGFSKNG